MKRVVKGPLTFAGCDACAVRQPIAANNLIYVDRCIVCGSHAHEDAACLKSKALTPKVIDPQSKWPKWAKAVAVLRSDRDEGVGDTVEGLLGAIGRGGKLVLQMLGVPCGCDRRKGEWNESYPYSLLEPGEVSGTR